MIFQNIVNLITVILATLCLLVFVFYAVPIMYGHTEITVFCDPLSLKVINESACFFTVPTDLVGGTVDIRGLFSSVTVRVGK